jgi:transcriptional regulator with XRE-family HTH domain
MAKNQSTTSWTELRNRRMKEPGAEEEYKAAQLAYELGRAVRELREKRGWSQTELARFAKMTQSAVARFEAGGTIPTLPVLIRLAAALRGNLEVRFVAGDESPTDTEPDASHIPAGRRGILAGSAERAKVLFHHTIERWWPSSRRSTMAHFATSDGLGCVLP